MNSIHNNGHDEKSLNDELDQLGQTYERLQQDEPPALLDQAILNSAHRAVDKKPHWMKFGWSHGLATAAVFVLAFSVILNQPETPPVFEDGFRNAEPVSLKREKAAKKQSLDGKSDDIRGEMKEISESRPAVPQSAPAAPAPAGVSADSVSVDGSADRSTRARRTMVAEEALQVTGARSDKDATPADMPEQEMNSDEVDNIADFPVTSAIYKTNLASPAAAVSEGLTAEREIVDAEIEQRLLNIIELKRAGNETWKSELQSFLENYPDHPLPDELKQ